MTETSGYIILPLFGLIAIGLGAAWLKWSLRYIGWMKGYAGPDRDLRLQEYEPLRRSGYFPIAAGIICFISTVVWLIKALVR
ncbi:hypothetical protein BTM25_22710 [Actinomadura rubteroloni]|uniref:Uncharacterized protein n=1 Tax=Actinomadura rubteroloni TaxID=1926885 RepID=A0A2P4US31_9ACTN|nr:hypothetical protein [Actinomadura rubteroloni]POM27848.1 hypothetical protein BTM25_22710 [Actinomadura rubteroloni]